MADRRDEHAAPERIDDQFMQDLAVDVAAHPTRPVTAGQAYGVDVVESGSGPGDGILILRGFEHLGVRGACIAVGPQESADDDHPAQSRNP